MESKEVISNALQKAYGLGLKFNNIMVSISGGADSDVMLDLLLKTIPKEKMTFVFLIRVLSTRQQKNTYYI